MQKTKIFNLIILDESGSMESIKNTIISGFNEVVQSVKLVAEEFPEQEHFISLVSFDSTKIKTIHDIEPVEKLEKLDDSKYKPGAMTPLYDAMGTSILQLKRVTETHPDCKVLVTILTDGEENASKEFNGQSIKALVDELQAKNWTFSYIGANHDVEKFAISISIKNYMKFETNEQDMQRMFSEEKNARMNYSKKIRDNEDEKTDFYKK